MKLINEILKKINLLENQLLNEKNSNQKLKNEINQLKINLNEKENQIKNFSIRK